MGESNESSRLDLSSILESEDPDKVKQSMDRCLKQAETFSKKFKGRIQGFSPSQFFNFYKELDEIQTIWYRHYKYTWLRLSQDFTDMISKSLFEYAMKLESEFRSKLLFTETEVARVLVNQPDLVNDPAVKEYRHELEKLLERGKYLLSEEDERLIVNKDLYGVDSWSQLHSELINSRKYEVVIEGEKKVLGFAELRQVAEGSTDRNSRKAAVEALYEGFSRDKLVYAAALKSVFGNYLSQVKLRESPSVLTNTLIHESISQDTLDSLISTILGHTDLIRRYLRLRAKLMNLPKLTGYDVSPGRIAPFFEEQSTISWSESRRLLTESYSEFDQEAGDFITSLFDNNRVDAGSRHGKRGQAFCSSFAGLRIAFVSVPRRGDFSSVAELAHECGHALHMHFASENHNWINTMYGGCIAETGSIFGEMIVNDKLLEASDSDETRLTVLDRVLGGLYINVYFCVNAYLFEEGVFNALENSESIDGDKLGSIWMDARTEIFGDSVDWLPGMEQCWISPAQFFWPRDKFYHFTYAFAQLLVFVLYRLYKEEGSSFVPKMKRILSAGSSESPKTLLAEIGLDLTDPKFWEIGFKQAERYLDEFEKLVKKRT
ncbi:MAG: M3 family metallopeptidase [Candidatus Thorarchaeota archaeon]